MGFVQRALFTWFILVFFLILLCLRLEQRIQWSYFLIFIPFWIYDLILIIWIVLELIKRHQHHRVVDSFKKQVVNLVMLFHGGQNNMFYLLGISSIFTELC